MNNIVFTSASILDLLTQIDELKAYNISIVDGLGDSIQLGIGNSTYCISTTNSTDVAVSSSVVDEIEDVCTDAYESIKEDISFENINSGILKEIAKTLLVGGLVRFTGKLLKK